MKFLITGGAGFIGSSLCEHLLKNQHQVICFDNFDNFYPRISKVENITPFINHPNFLLVEGDLRDPEKVATLFAGNNIDLVIHLAAKAGVRPSILDPKTYVDVNINGTMNLLESMKSHGVKKIIFSSSSSVYGNNEKIPYAENDNVDFPISPYAATKKSGELLTYTYHHLHQFSVVNLRFFTVFGPRQRPDLAIHKFFDRLYKGQEIEMYGDGSTSRDYTYIDDIVSGILQAADLIQHKKLAFYETINLGNSHPITLRELIDLIEQVCTKKFRIKQMPMQEGDVNRTFADISKAKGLLGYSPQTDMRNGLSKFKNWYESKHN